MHWETNTNTYRRELSLPDDFVLSSSLTTPLILLRGMNVKEISTIGGIHRTVLIRPALSETRRWHISSKPSMATGLRCPNKVQPTLGALVPCIPDLYDLSSGLQVPLENRFDRFREA